MGTPCLVCDVELLLPSMQSGGPARCLFPPLARLPATPTQNRVVALARSLAGQRSVDCGGSGHRLSLLPPLRLLLRLKEQRQTDTPTHSSADRFYEPPSSSHSHLSSSSPSFSLRRGPVASNLSPGILCSYGAVFPPPLPLDRSPLSRL